VNHLTTHPDRRIASKATLLVGRRIRNQDWLSQRLDSEDGRVRASAVEGLWGVASRQAQAALCAALNDKNNRVVGNALIGLHRLGEARVNEFVKRMIEDPRPPFRWTAAWVMSKIAAEEFREYLERATKDQEPHVRRQAERALESIRPVPVADAPPTDPQP
ncbi:MAG TPA: HEAT repeat domain-containing protein, partial [Bryobacteraceae bacterium]|nr:HEAT repeat domain-containing protein [Bryobacteraceae bacterium]